MDYTVRSDTTCLLQSNALNNTNTSSTVSFVTGNGFTFPNDGETYVAAWDKQYTHPSEDAQARFGLITSRSRTGLTVSWGKLGSYITAKSTQCKIAVIYVNASVSVDTTDIYNSTKLTVAPRGSGQKADYYTDGTNDEVQINQALVAANALPKGGTVRLKAGTYTISSAIKPLNNTKLQGDGMHNTIILGSGSDFTALDNRDGTLGTPSHDVEICDLKIDMDAVTVVSADPIDVKCIFITYIQRMFIHGVWCYGSPGTGIGTDFLVDSVIDRCLVEKCGKAGISGTNQSFIGCNGFGIGSGKYANESWIVSNCIAKTIGNNGFLAENLNSATDSYNAQFVNCTAYSCGVGFRITGVSQIVVSNCVSYSNYNHGVWVESDDAGSTTNPKRVILSNVISTHNGTQGQNTGVGFYINDSFTAGNRLRDITINSCVSYYNSNHGIWVRNTKGVMITNTRSDSNRNQGILIEASINASTNAVSDITISNCQIANNSNTALGSSTDHDAIKLQAPTNSGTISNVIITGNRMYDDQAVKTQAYAVNVESSSSTSNIIIANNNMVGNKNSAPLFIGSAVGVVNFYSNLGVSELVTRTGTTTMARLEKTIHYNNSAPVTVTAPDATLMSLDEIRIVKDKIGTAGTNNITIAASGAQTIDGSANTVISTNKGCVMFKSDGSNLFIVGKV